MQQISNGKHAQDSVGITDLLNSLMHYAETALWTAKCNYTSNTRLWSSSSCWKAQHSCQIWILFKKIAIKRLNVFPNIEVHFPLVQGNFCKCKKLSQFAFHFCLKMTSHLLYYMLGKKLISYRHRCCQSFYLYALKLN